MQVYQQLKNPTFLRIYSFLTSLVLSMSILLSILGAINGILIQTIASIAIVLGTLLELFQILIIMQLANRTDKVGWILHRFSYVTLLVMILSFLSVVGGAYVSSFLFLGRDVMFIAVIGYTMQASFGICLSSISYHFLLMKEIWSE